MCRIEYPSSIEVRDVSDDSAAARAVPPSGLISPSLQELVCVCSVSLILII